MALLLRAIARALSPWRASPVYSATGDLRTTHKLLEGIEGKDDIDVNARDEWGRTPLHKDWLAGKLQIAEFLPQQRKANVKTVDGHERIPL